MATKGQESLEIKIPELGMRTIRAGLIGLTPYVCNRVSEKAKRELLEPPPKSHKDADRAVRPQKHNPLAEYGASAERLLDGPTLIGIKAASFKRAMATAGIDLPGAKKAQIARLVWVPGYILPLYGVPQLWMTVVRQADMNHTPDIRTRAILPQWACVVDIQYVSPLLSQEGIANLLSAAGRMVGVGDGRQEKGALDFGQFTIVDPDDPTLLAIMETGGRAAQVAALDGSPTFYDIETADLFESWAPRDSREPVMAMMGKNGGAE